MVAQISKPGVEITQVFQGTAPTATSPSLIPCIVGPAFEVVDLTGDNGLANAEGRLENSQGAVLYNQLPATVLPANYPTPHADPNQMEILANEVSVGLNTTGVLNTLARNPGSAFLDFVNLGHQPAIFISDAALARAAASTNLIIAVDSISRASVANDHIVAMPTGWDGTQVSDLADAINTKVGQTVAFDTTINSVDGLLLKSTRFGAAASITLRKVSGSTDSTFLHSIIDASADHQDRLRVEGAGLHAQDQTAVGVITSPFVVHSTGKLYGSSAALTGSEITELGNDGISFLQYDIDGNSTSSINAVNFVSDFQIKAATSVSNGDLLSAYNSFGQSISSVMITEVKSDRLRLGVVDTIRSQYDADGDPTSQFYIDFQLGELLSNSNPFAPKNGYIVAQNLTSANSSATASKVTSGALSVTDATSASLVLVGVTNTTLQANVGTSFVISLTEGTVVTEKTISITSEMSEANLVTTFNTLLGDKFSNAYNAGTDTLTISSVSKGVDISISATGAALTGIAPTSQTATAGTDTILSGLNGKNLYLSFNGSNKSYVIQANGNSIEDLIELINERVGATVATYDYTNDKIVITAYLVGIASSVHIGSSTDTIFELITGATTTEGTGRPNPDVLVANDGQITIGAEINRHSRTGRPLNVSSDIHIGYRALRIDLSPAASNPGIIRVSNTTDLESIYGPINTRNPLALAIYFALLNAGSGTEVSAIGLDDVSTAEPEGTTLSYQRALEFLRSHEVYSVVPLTQSEDVIGAFDTHVKDMSLPANRAERVLISAPVNPTRHNDTAVLSTGSNGAQSTGTENQIDLNASPESALAAQGLDTSVDIPFELSDGRQLYIKLTTNNTTYVLSVIRVNGGVLTVRSTYTTSQNGDNFYTETSLPSSFSGATFSLALRGKKLVLTGSDRLDKTAYATTIRDKAQQYLNRRQLRLYPDQVQTSAIGGVNSNIPSYYFAAALAGACANVEPQEPFTRVPLVGFNDVVGPQLERSHLDIMSAGNAVVEVEVQGQLPALRMQSTTDPSTIENREWSVTRAVDFFAKQCRQQLRLRIGRFNITQAYLDDLTILMDSLCNTATSNGLFRSANLLKLEQDQAQPDTILVEVNLEVLYPANYIKLTLVV